MQIISQIITGSDANIQCVAGHLGRMCGDVLSRYSCGINGGEWTVHLGPMKTEEEGGSEQRDR